MNKKIQSSIPPLACVILAAGAGSRMKSDLPKVLHKIAGRAMISHVIDACDAVAADKIVAVIGANADAVQKAIAPIPCVIQETPRGTGDAVRMAQKALAGFKGDVLVLYGDTPLITPEAIDAMCCAREESNASIVVSGFEAEFPDSYGRLIMGAHGLEAIVEDSDATARQKKIKLCNGGIMLFDGDKIWDYLAKIKNNNAKREFYLTDAIAIARGAGDSCAVSIIPEEDLRGVNSRGEQVLAEAEMQLRLRFQALDAGVTMIDDQTVYLSSDTKFGRDVVIDPNVFFGAGVVVGDGVHIRAFSHLENVRIGAGAIIGPFARLRPGADIGDGAHIGNFVEIKNAKIGAGAKVNHLSYVGDASVGNGANIGAGTITCNYDGVKKHQTHIGAGAFIGSNTALVAPVKIGDGAIIGAGSVIDKDVPDNALGIERVTQKNIDGFADKYRKSRR